MVKQTKASQPVKKKPSKGIFLSGIALKEIEEVLTHYELEQRIELAEHLLEMFREVGEYFKSRDNNIYKKYADREGALLKKYGKLFKPFARKRFDNYFDFDRILSIKDYYTDDEYNNLKEDEGDLKESDIYELTFGMNNFLNGELHFSYLEREPLFEIKAQADLSGKDIADKEMTEARQLLAIYYVFKAGFEIEHRESNSISQMTHFAHLLLGKKFTTLQNSSIYKKYKLIPNYNSDEQLIKDLKYIKGYFEELDLKKAVDLINNQIESTIKELPLSRRKTYM